MADIPAPLVFDNQHDIDLVKTYDRFIREELDEILDALALPDAHARQQAIGDGLCDAMVFLATAISRLGYLHIFPNLYLEVARSNDTKGEGDKLFHEGGKMIKGDSYTPPDFSKFWDMEFDIPVNLATVFMKTFPSGHDGIMLVFSAENGGPRLIGTNGVPPFITLAALRLS